MITDRTYKEVEGWEAQAFAQLPDGAEHGVVSDCAVDADDRVFLLSRSGSVILIYDRDGHFLKSWGHNETGKRPHGITIAPDNSVWIAFDEDHTVRKFTLDGEQLLVVGVSGVASENGAADWSNGLAKRLLGINRGGPPFNGPTKVAIAPNGDVYISDGYGNARVHQFTPSGDRVRSWGGPGREPSEFLLPHGIDVTSDGRVLVADQQNDRVQIFSLEGEFLGLWSAQDVYHPLCVVVHHDLVYVAEGSRVSIADPNTPRPARISVFDLNGKVVTRIGEKPLDNPTRLVAPHGVAIDSQGHVYVAEVLGPLTSYQMPMDIRLTIHKFEAAG
jgi:outer membrane protein assembly factor BamB